MFFVLFRLFKKCSISHTSYTHNNKANLISLEKQVPINLILKNSNGSLASLMENIPKKDKIKENQYNHIWISGHRNPLLNVDQ